MLCQLDKINHIRDIIGLNR